ncbi:class I SAM-dependent methyltransferase, partial [Flavobacterium bomense]
GRILDIGAGTGDFLSVAKNAGWETIGVEPSDRAKAIAKSKGVSFVEETSELDSHSFDVISMWHVLEHVPDLDKQIKELKRLLKPTGTLIIAVPNFKSFDAKHYGKFWAAFDVPIHFWHFSKTAIKILFEKEEMILEKVLPMKFDSFYVSLLSEKYKSGKMNFMKAFFTGLQSNWKAKKDFEYSSHIYILKNKRNSF